MKQNWLCVMRYCTIVVVVVDSDNAAAAAAAGAVMAKCQIVICTRLYGCLLLFTGCS